MKKLNPAVYSKNNEYTTKQSLFQEGKDGLNVRKSVDSCVMTSLVTQRAKKSVPAMQEIQIRSLGREEPLEKKVATLSSILAGKSPRTEEPGGYSPWGHKESDRTEWLSTFILVLKKNWKLWELWVKFCLGKNEDYILSDGSEKLPREGKRRSQNI